MKTWYNLARQPPDPDHPRVANLFDEPPRNKPGDYVVKMLRSITNS